MGTFRGWPAEALEFWAGLEADNSRTFWQANKAVYDRAVRAPMEALLADLDAEFGPFHLFRPHRDVRFTKDKTPYKTAIAAVGEAEGGEMHYLQFSAQGLLVATGAYTMAADQLARHRAAIDDPAAGGDLAAVVTDLRRRGYAIGAMTTLRTAPRGYPKDHPRIELLRMKGCMASRTFPPAAWLHTARARDRVVATWRGAAALNAWLARHVGPSELPPDDLW